MSSHPQSPIVVGLDATNLRSGGGRTHLIELLRSAEPERHGFSKLIVWGSGDTLDRLPDEAWIQKCNPPELEGNVLVRTQWQYRELSKAARSASCDILFVPGGNYLGDFHPVVTMSRNSLPFEGRELARYGVSVTTLRLLMLRLSQSRTFRRADGVIFLTRYAERLISRTAGRIEGATAIIPHGISDRFVIPPRPQRSIEACGPDNPFRLLYVSNLDLYKHQWSLVEAVARLRAEHGWALALDLVGGVGNASAARRLEISVQAADPAGQWVRWRGAVPHDELHRIYVEADIGVFASSCENMPNILIETMAAGLPIACSKFDPMPEVLGDAGVYFDPEDPGSIAAALQELIGSRAARQSNAQSAYAAAGAYSWARCADETFQFLQQVRARHTAGPCRA